MYFAMKISYLIAAILFIFGLREMSSPRTAYQGIIYSGLGMALAIAFTFFAPGMHGITNYTLMLVAIALATAIAWYSAAKVKMIAMPQMIALYNGMGGGAAAAIALFEWLQPAKLSIDVKILALVGAFIGLIAFSGSLIAFAKLQDLIRRNLIYAGQNIVNSLITLASVLVIILLLMGLPSSNLLILFTVLTLVLGITITLPIGGANMPVVISLFNAMTGIAVGFEGYVLHNEAMIIAGTVVGAAGSLLTMLMAKAMNQKLKNILVVSGVSQTGPVASGEELHSKTIDLRDAAISLNYAKSVVIVPGYGMAVAQAQHRLAELVELLTEHGVSVKFAIHPVAGRMPGHMNVLLAEAQVSYDKIFDMEVINPELRNTDVVLVIGANDVVNPMAREDPSCPIYGMPIIDVDKAKQVIVIKRGQGKGFSGIDNALFFKENVAMLYGDGQKVVTDLIQAIKTI